LIDSKNNLKKKPTDINVEEPSQSAENQKFCAKERKEKEGNAARLIKSH
jgi:hypothetical protein